MKNDRPVLIVFGGFPGAGKTTIARRISFEFSLPHLSADSIGQMIRRSPAMKDGNVNAAWIAHDVLFALCREFLTSDISLILDLNMGWRFQWEQLEGIKGQFPRARMIPFILKCRKEFCLQRIGQRYHTDSEGADPPALYSETAHIRNVFTFLEQLDRTDTYEINAEQPQEVVYEEVRDYLQSLLPSIRTESG